MRMTFVFPFARAQVPTKERAETPAGSPRGLHLSRRDSQRCQTKSHILFFRIEQLPHGLGEVECSSLEEEIWRELGALPPSRR